MEKTKTISVHKDEIEKQAWVYVRLPRPLHKEFKIYLAQNGMTMQKFFGSRILAALGKPADELK
jgi:hypothetical protein